MSVPHISRRLATRTYRVVRILIRLIFVLVLLGLLLFVYLRVQGVPGPLLRMAMRRANDAGIPVSVEGITLTLNGWRADRVRYYSNHPDDLDPLFESEHVFFSVHRQDGTKAMKVETRAVGVNIAPSVEWGISIPESSSARTIEQVDVDLDFLEDRITLSNGRMEWLDSRFNINGSILKKTSDLQPPAGERQGTVSPVLVSAAQIQALEEHLKILSLPTGAEVDIDFEIDTGNYAASHLNFSAHAEGLALQEIEFSRAEVSGSYAYPWLRLQQAGVFEGKQSLQLSGAYNLKTHHIEGTLFNSITSNRLLMLLPEKVHDLMTKAQLRFDHLPRLEINFGPAPAMEILNHLAGSFSIRGVGYQGLEVETVRGRVERKNNRLEFSQLQGSALGQEHRTAEAGSSMHGGTAEGLVFWDGNTREFGVDLDATFDPHILVQALSPIKIATNIIHYFSFKDQPPRGHISLGSNVDDWKTFYIDIQMVANEVAFRGVELSSLNLTQTYQQGKLVLDPVAAVQGAEFAKGAVEIDFRNDTVTFDVEGSLQPAALERMIYPSLNLFGEKVKTQGNARLSARGLVDWGTMKRTDFTATVTAEKLEIPVGVADEFKAEIIGKGPLLSVQNATFLLYGGPSQGEFHIQLNPATNAMPYTFNTTFSAVDFKKFLAFFSGKKTEVYGDFSGHAHIEADMATNFFSSANGEISIRVDNGQLADLPFFSGFTKLMRMMIPKFSAFSITRLKGDLTISDGVISSENINFIGDVISASGRGNHHPVTGFDAYVQTHLLNDGGFGKLLRVLTDPLMKLFEMRLTGTLSNPIWKLEKL